MNMDVYPMVTNTPDYGRSGNMKSHVIEYFLDIIMILFLCVCVCSDIFIYLQSISM